MPQEQAHPTLNSFTLCFTSTGQEDELIDCSLLTPQVMANLRVTDPFSYYSILMAQQGTTLCDFDNLNENFQVNTAGDGDTGAGGVQVRNNSSHRYSWSENNSFPGEVSSRLPLLRSPRRVMRRSSMPSFEAASIQTDHHLPRTTLVRRQRRFATETDACTALEQMMSSLDHDHA